MKKAKIKNLVLDLLYDIIGAFFYAVGFYTFAKMANFAPGGLTGLALIMNSLWKFPIGITTMVLNIPLILISGKLVWKNFFIKNDKDNVFLYIVPGYYFSPSAGIHGFPVYGSIIFRYLYWNQSGLVLYERFFVRWN